MNACFPRCARVRTRAEFEAIFKRGRRIATPVFALHWLNEGVTPRLGLAVSRKVSTRAVERNRIKRALREMFRTLRMQIPMGDYVFVARLQAAKTTSVGLQNELIALLRRAGALPQSDAQVTMQTVSVASSFPSHPAVDLPAR